MPGLPELLLSALEGIGDGFLIFDAEWRYAYVNRRAEQLLGVGCQEILGQNVWERYPDAIGTELERTFRAAAAGEARELENYYAPWGRWFENRCFPVEGGGISVFFIDITERKLAEAKLRESEQHYAYAQEASGESSYDWNLGSGTVHHQDRWLEVLGLDRGDGGHPENSLDAYVHPDDRGSTRAGLRKVLDRASDYQCEYRILLPGGRTLWVLDRGKVVERCADDGAPLRVVGTLMDITERKQAETAILEAERTARESREWLDLALSVSGLGLWEFYFLRSMVRMDERLSQMLGIGAVRYEMSLADWLERVHPDDLAAFRQATAAHEQGETVSQESEIRFRHLEGHWVWLQMRGKITVRGASGNPVLAIGTLLDVSHQKRVVNESAGLLRQIEGMLQQIARGPRAEPASPPPEAARLALLTARQKEVLRLIADGCNSTEISKRLNLSRETVVTHRRDLMRRLDLHSVAELTKFALRTNLLSD